ncbi:thiopeptide-type bacteriocin biosynthesis protein [Planomonospora corallina]|uniref:Thiopeptide-type bacteriocin biosynthesis protein n=1 Tax=Planomonospora corallina TaxID=1806052 RepID=A0ABV8I0Z2_9ACTN
MTLDTPEWWFVRLYTGGFAASDLLVTEVLPPLVAEARAHGAVRWFFIRYTDPSGPHLRVRVFGPRETVDRMHRSLARVQRHADAVLAEVVEEAAWLTSIPMRRMLGDSGTGLASGLYEPEYGKYGGPQGVELAERVFEFSSDLAIWATTRFRKIPERASFAVLLLQEAVRALIEGRPGDLSPEPVLPPADRRRQLVGWERYWERHLAWWTADLARHAPELQAELRRHAEQDAHGVRAFAGALRADSAVDPWLRRWGQVIDDSLVRAHRMHVGLTPQHLVFHQSHMMMNRLGFLPREEALLGIIAAGREVKAKERIG